MGTRPNDRSMDSLGCGSYRVAEVARYTGLAASTVRAWFRGRSDRKGRGPVFRSDLQIISGVFSVSFRDMIDALVAGQFRTFGVRMSVVRRAYDHLRATLGPHPFCHQDLYTDGRAIIIRTAHAISQKRLEEKLSDAVSGQALFSQIKTQLQHVRYSPQNALAESWRIDKGVVIDPRRCFGRPAIEHTGISAFVVARAYFANRRDAELVGDLFEIPVDAVHDAVRFESRICEAA